MYSGNFDLLSTCRDLSSPVFFKRRNQKQVVIGGIAVAFELMGIILAGFSYVLLCSIAYLPGFASTGSLVVKPNIKLREKKK